jgi:hypothetical protein
VANVVEFRAAAESKTAGITKLEVVADPAVPADLVTLVAGPTGWKVGTGSSGVSPSKARPSRWVRMPT